MKKYFNLIAIIIISLNIFTHCKKDKIDDNQNTAPISSMKELQVPSGFDFSTMREIDFTASIEDDMFGNNKYKIELFDKFPSEGTSPRVVVIASKNQNASVKARISRAVKNVFVVVNYPNGIRDMRTVSIEGDKVNFTFKKMGRPQRKTQINPNGCTGCTVTLNNFSNYNGNFWGNEIICISGTFTGGFNIGGNVQVRICPGANVNFSYFNANNNASLEINAGATLTTGNINFNGNTSAFRNWSNNVTITSNFSPNGKVYNEGILNINGQFNCNSGSEIVNYGEINTTSDININHKFLNHGKVASGNTIHFNSSSNVQNYCSMTANNNFHFNGILENCSYMRCNNEMYVNSSTTITLYDGAMIKGGTGNTYFNKVIQAYGSTSSIVIPGPLTINSSGGIAGNVELCATNIVANNGAIVAPASIGCNNFIPTSPCNPEGFGTPSIVDSDGDGVPDNIDEYPNDPLRAYNLYFPSQNGFNTLAFEDLWPAYGDFDFNDLVIHNRMHFVLNANMGAVELFYTYKVVAIGASQRNAFGIQFDNLLPSAIQSVDGQLLSGFTSIAPNGTENGQSKAVVIIFDNAFSALPNPGTPFVNTVPNQTFVAPIERVVTINFSSPIPIANIGDWNPFTIVNQNRGREVHLPGFQPTDLANTTLFGTIDDNTGASGFLNYTSKTGLPWAIEIPDIWKYPIEKEDIVGVYQQFAPWAQSGGVQYPLWYVDNGNNVVTSKIYNP
ncbi:LruC domain-containing protein [Schleiferia thermophila]|uniref:LruC domain-containing protein n=1 Tax=Schleiferia thermophila TaxID=884107 RepID=UPI003EF044AE